MQLHRFAADDGEEIRTQVAGSGPPIVLLHEWASSHRVWEPIAHRLSDRFTVYRWDARGHHGHGEPLPPSSGRPVSVERMADDLASLLHHFQAGTAGGGRPLDGRADAVVLHRPARLRQARFAPPRHDDRLTGCADDGHEVADVETDLIGMDVT